MRAIPLLLAFAISCGPASGWHESLSTAGVPRLSLVEVTVQSPEKGRAPKRLDSSTFGTPMENSSAPGDWRRCVEGSVLLVTSTSRPDAAATLVVHEGEGMKLKAGGRIVRFESPSLRAAVRGALKTAESR